jgi:hypothetical protein
MKLVRFNAWRVTLLVSLLLAWTNLANAADYFVANNGSDGRSCSQAQSISAPKQSINNALGCLSAGDTLQVRGGYYSEFISRVPSGTSWGNVVRIKAYNSETVWLNPSGSPYVVYLARNEQYIEFDGLNLDNRNLQGGAIRIESWANGNPHHIRFKNAEIVGGPNGIANEFLNGPQAISATASVPGLIGGNEFINLTIHGGGDSGDFYYGFYINSPDNLIDGCNIYDVAGAGIQIYSSYGTESNGNVIRNNTIHDITRSGDWRAWGVIVANGNGNTLYNNVIYGIGLAGYGNAGISLQAGTNTNVYNNTLYGSVAGGIYVGQVSQARVINNIIYRNSGGNYINYGSGTQESNNMTSDPGFLNAAGGDFRLRSGAAAIDQGVYLGDVRVDKAGVSRPRGSAYDIGAYEYDSGGSSSPPPEPAPAPPPGGGTPPASGSSPDGTRVPGSSQIVDGALAVWTLGSGQRVLRNGAQPAGAYGSQILWYQGAIYVLGDDSNWWRWTGATWSFYGSSDPNGGAPPTGGSGPSTPAPTPAPTASPSGSRTPPSSSVVDNGLAVWTIGPSLEVLRNGSQAAGGYATQILWFQSSIYVLGDDNNWWRWTGVTWTFHGSRAPG